MKKFFYACAAILCLVLAYHFGATNAQGQSGASFQVISPRGWVRAGDTVYTYEFNPPHWGVYSDLPPVPPSALLFLSADLAITQSGDSWVKQGGSGWQNIGPVPGGATPAIQQSFGQLKAKYR